MASRTTAVFPDRDHANQAIDRLVERSFEPRRLTLESASPWDEREVGVVVHPRIAEGVAFGTIVGIGAAMAALFAVVSMGGSLPPLGMGSVWINAGFSVAIGGVVGGLLGGYGGLAWYTAEPAEDLDVFAGEELILHYRGPRSRAREAAELMAASGASMVSRPGVT